MSDQALLLCRECNDLGRLPDRSECGHTAVYAAIARRGVEAAKQQIRPPRLPNIGAEQ